jgi:hypothetical protein
MLTELLTVLPATLGQVERGCDGVFLLSDLNWKYDASP